MPYAVIFTGIQASGKTSYYNENFSNYVHINLDTLRTRNRERLLLEQCISCNADFVADNTNPTPEDRQKYIISAKAAGYTIIGYYFSSPVGVCIERNKKRRPEQRVPDIAVASTHRKLILPSFDEGFDKLFYVRLTKDGFITEEWRNDNEL